MFKHKNKDNRITITLIITKNHFLMEGMGRHRDGTKHAMGTGSEPSISRETASLPVQGSGPGKSGRSRQVAAWSGFTVCW